MADKVCDKVEDKVGWGGALGYFTRQPVNPLDNVEDSRHSTRQPLAVIGQD